MKFTKIGMRSSMIVATLLPLLIYAGPALDAKQEVEEFSNIWVHVDFHVSMQTDSYPDAIKMTNQVVGIDGSLLMDFFKGLYDQNNPTKVKVQNQLKIPKLIHQIWLGSPLPAAFKDLIESWMNHHAGRGWRYRLWTDEDVKGLQLVNQEFYDATDNYGVKSDLMKWELVYRFGGVYIDMDFECLQSLDLLHYTYDFYTGIQPLDTQFVQLGAALFGARAGHPILKECIETIRQDWHKKGAPAKSGPIHFTRSFYQTAGKNNSIDIAFPASYLYPLGCLEREFNRDLWIKQGAFAVHHWAKSWMPAKYRYKQFRTLNNEHLVDCWND